MEQESLEEIRERVDTAIAALADTLSLLDRLRDVALDAAKERPKPCHLSLVKLRDGGDDIGGE